MADLGEGLSGAGRTGIRRRPRGTMPNCAVGNGEESKEELDKKQKVGDGQALISCCCCSVPARSIPAPTATDQHTQTQWAMANRLSSGSSCPAAIGRSFRGIFCLFNEEGEENTTTKGGMDQEKPLIPASHVMGRQHTNI